MVRLFECAVIDGSETSDSFKIESFRSKAGICDTSILILTSPGLDNEEDNGRQEKSETVEFHNSAGGPDFEDVIALLSSKLNDLHENTGKLTEEVTRVGPKLNAR